MHLTVLFTLLFCLHGLIYGQAEKIDLRADPLLIARGDKSSLKWDTAGAEEVQTVSLKEKVSGKVLSSLPSGSAEIQPSQTTTYILLVKAKGEEIRRECTVNVVTFHFEADRQEIYVGQDTSLYWMTAGASKVTLVDKEAGKEVEVPPLGSKVVKPKKDVSYTLKGLFKEGGELKKELNLTVKQPLTIADHLKTVEQLYTQLGEFNFTPGFEVQFIKQFEQYYGLLENMQAAADAAHSLYLREGIAHDKNTSVDPIVRIHILLAAAAAKLAYEDLYDRHIEIATTILKRSGQVDDVTGSAKWQAGWKDVLDYKIGTDSSLRKEICRWGSKIWCEDALLGEPFLDVYQGAGKRVDLLFDRSARLYPLSAFAVDVARETKDPAAKLFAVSLSKQLAVPIVRNWYLTNYVEEARRRKINIEAEDYFQIDEADKEKSGWHKELLDRLQTDTALNPVRISATVPIGQYIVHRRGIDPSGLQSNLVVDSNAARVPTRFILRMSESGSLVEVTPVYPEERLSVRNLLPRFEVLDFRLGTNRQTQDLEGSFGGRMFQRFGSHLALQTQGQFEFQNYSDRLDLDQLLLKLAGQSPFPRDQRGFTNYSSREFQLDVGPVLRFKNAQFSVMQSLRYVTRSDFDQGGMLGQFFFNAGYVSKDWGQIGVFATIANLDQPVVKSVQFNQVFFEETYLKIADQAGLNFQLGPKWLPGYFEGTIGYLNTTWVKGAVGGTVRYVAPWPNKKFSLTAEVGYNEGFVRSGESSLRVGGGFRLGNWSKPTDFRDEKGPVPVIVPAIRYETLTRIVRRGNDAPVANAGPDINNVDPGALVTLDGRGSSDPDSDPITYSWIQVSGPAATLANPVSATPSFQAGNFGDNYTFKLIVCDNFGLCSDAANSTACPSSGSSTDACVSVTVRKAPQIASFTATPAQVDVGQCSLLSWQTTNADHVTLAPDIGEVPASGSRSVCPATTTKYTLTAYSGTFSASSDITVSVHSAQIASFAAAPAQINSGDCSTLSWKVQDAVRVSIAPDLGDVPLVGSGSVCPKVTTTYTLTAFSADGTTATQNVQITVNSALIQTFSATPANINLGGSSTLSWKVLSAVKVTIEPGLGEVALEGSKSVSPTATTKYTLTAFSADNKTVTQDVQVTVNSPQVISFTADATSQCSSQCTTLRWSTSSAARVVISPNIGEVPLQGSHQVCPTSTTTYTLTAFAVNSSQTATASVQVTIKPSPTITQFSASKTSILAGESVQLSWTTQGADTVMLTPPGQSVSLSGSMVVAPISTQSYNLTAKNACNQVTQSITINVRSLPPEIISFTASPSLIIQSGTTTLTWATRNAQSVTITNLQNAPATLPLNSAQLPGGGLQQTLGSTTTFTLTAMNKAGVTVSASATVTVQPAVPGILSFTASPPQCLSGQCSQLNWQVSSAQTVSLTNDGTGDVKNVTGQSMLPVCPTVSTTYTLKACNSAGQCVSADATVTVIVQGPPVIDKFQANPLQISAGGTSVLSWVVGSAEQVTLINGDDGTATPVASVVSSWPVSPKNTTVYTLMAVNRFAASVTSSVTVTVK
jgi:hypothetical protein